MRLNPDCIRDILISVEQNTNYNEHLLYPQELKKCPALTSYKDDEIRYHIKQCLLANLIIGVTEDLAGNIRIKDLTPTGHEFLANIRSDTVWNKTKNIAAKIGSFSLNALKDIAVGVISEIIKSELNQSN